MDVHMCTHVRAGVVRERVYKLGVHVTVAEGEPAEAMDTS